MGLWDSFTVTSVAVAQISPDRLLLHRSGLYFKSGYQAHLGLQAVEVQLLSQSHLGRRTARWSSYPAMMGSESNKEHPITGSFWGPVAWPERPQQSCGTLVGGGLDIF